MTHVSREKTQGHSGKGGGDVRVGVPLNLSSASGGAEERSATTIAETGKKNKYAPREAANQTMEAFSPGLAKAPKYTPSSSMMHGAAEMILHMLFVSLIRLVQQENCQQKRGRVMWSDRPMLGTLSSKRLSVIH